MVDDISDPQARSRYVMKKLNLSGLDFDAENKVFEAQYFDICER